MHVVHVVRDLDRDSGGPSRSVPQLAEHLSKNGESVTLFFQDRGNKFVDVADGVGTIQIPQLGWRDIVGIRKTVDQSLSELHDRLPISVFHMHGVWDQLTHLTSRFARKAKLKYVWSPRGMLEPWSLSQKPIKKKLAWLAWQKSDLQHAAALHATAEMEADNLKELGLTAPKFVIPNGIPNTPAVELANRKRNPQVALFLSRIHPKKGIELLIDAWRNLKPNGWICQIVGPGDPDYLSSLRSRIDSAGLTGVIELLPPIDDARKWAAYERASLFVLPTYSENFGIVVAEALAMRLPVITTTGTPWSMLPTKNCGWYIEPNVPQLTDALAAAFKMSDEQLQKMGDDGQEFVDSVYRWEGIARRFKGKYQDIAG